MLRLLGPVEIPGAPDTTVDSPRQRLVLAVLAVEAGRAVPMEVLLDRVWGAEPPPQGRRTLQSYIVRARRVLAGMSGGPVAIEGRDGAYLLRLDPERVDLHRFRTLVGLARQPGCPPERRVELLREAVGLWRGQPLAGLGGVWPERMRESWQRERIAAVVAWADAELVAGDPAAVLGPMGDLAADHPLDEALAGASMRVLARLGRTAEALSQYERFRGRLVAELGIDPGTELRSVHQAVLRGAFDPPARGGPASGAPSARRAPAQLPAPLAVFAGRDDELATLDGLAATAAELAAPVVVVVSGTAGVGKTSLAVQWAHRVAHRFPDGQLYVNLRGFDPGGAALHPADVIRRFLDAFHTPAERVPADLDAQVNLYRSLLADRRVLVVLDNARDAGQVRPLLPVSGGCLTVVTSRSPQIPLVVTEGARTLTLDLMSVAEARELLVRRLGSARTDAEPDAVEHIVDRCARFPLALSIAAARAAAQPEVSLAATAGQLRDLTSALDGLDGGDAVTDVRSVFSWSYRSLSDEAARLFRRLGLHPGPDAGLPAVASLAATAPVATESLLGELTRAGLVHEHRPQRYAFHDLLRAYAIERAERQDTEGDRRAALGRLVEHYLDATRANAELAVMCWPLVADDASAGGPPSTAEDRARGLAWLAAEREVLLSVVEQAASAGLHTHAWQLAWALTFFLLRQGHWHDLRTIHEAALAASERVGDLAGQSHMMNGLALGYNRSGRFDEAAPVLGRAWALAEKTGDLILQARIQSSWTWLAERRGEPAAALRHARRSQALYQAAGSRRGEAEALGDAGWCHALLGEYRESIDCCERALAMLAGFGHLEAEASIADSLGYVHLQLGNFVQAVAWCQQSIDLSHEYGDLYNEAQGLAALGDIHQAAGDSAAARAAWRRALAILDDIEHPDAAEVRAKLDP